MRRVSSPEGVHGLGLGRQHSCMSILPSGCGGVAVLQIQLSGLGTLWGEYAGFVRRAETEDVLSATADGSGCKAK